jgi:hypothetical protein
VTWIFEGVCGQSDKGWSSWEAHEMNVERIFI